MDIKAHEYLWYAVNYLCTSRDDKHTKLCNSFDYIRRIGNKDFNSDLSDSFDKLMFVFEKYIKSGVLLPIPDEEIDGALQLIISLYVDVSIYFKSHWPNQIIE